MGVTTSFTLGSAVANSGTVTIAYPTGTAQADFTTPNNSATGVVVINSNDRWLESASQISIAYNAPSLVITNSTGVAWAAGSTVHVELGRAEPADILEVGPLADFTDNSTGTAGDTIAAGAGVETVALFLNLVDIADGDLLTTYTPGYAFKVLAADFRVAKPATTADKAATLNLEIGTTNVTGGEIALTSANCTPKGAAVAGAAITAANTGAANATISVEASSTTAFAEGTGWLFLKIQNMDTANAIASLADKQNDLLTLLRQSGILAAA
jgi:hypothetical protein